MPHPTLRRVLRITLVTTLAVVIGVPLVLLALLPWIAPLIPLPSVSIDLSKELPPDVAALVTNRTVTADLKLTRSARGGLILTARGQALDWPYTLRVDADYSIFTLSANAAVDFAFDGSDLRLSANASATPLTWQATGALPETTITEKEPLLASVLQRLDLGNVKDLSFGATLSALVKAEKTRALPVPVWTAKTKLSQVQVQCELNGSPLSVSDLQTTFGAEGIADRVTIQPAFPRIREVSASGIVLTDARATIRMSERGFLVNEASAGFCGGEIKVYSLFLDPKSLTAGFTLFLDDIDADRMMRQIQGFHGEASGRLHGKLPLFLKDGKELRLRNAYLYSTPGEEGSLKISDPTPILTNLAMSGVDQATCDNLGKALADLVYTVLKIELRRDDNGALALGFKVEGSATHGRTTVPVSFNVTFHGDLEQLINTGIRLGSGE